MIQFAVTPSFLSRQTRPKTYKYIALWECLLWSNRQRRMICSEDASREQYLPDHMFLFLQTHSPIPALHCHQLYMHHCLPQGFPARFHTPVNLQVCCTVRMLWSNRQRRRMRVCVPEFSRQTFQRSASSCRNGMPATLPSAVVRVPHLHTHGTLNAVLCSITQLYEASWSICSIGHHYAVS